MVIADDTAQYEMAKRNGDLPMACHEADMVALGYLSAQNEAAYKRWKDIAKSCYAKE